MLRPTSVSAASTKVFHRQLHHDLPVAVSVITDRCVAKPILDACGGARGVLPGPWSRVLAAILRQIDKLAYAHTSFFTTG
jgi:hypothetical protein